MAWDWDSALKGAGVGAGVGATTGMGIFSPVGALVGGGIGFLGGGLFGGNKEKQALAEASARMMETPVSAAQVSQTQQAGEQKAVAEGEQQRKDIVRSSATDAGTTGLGQTRQQDIARNLMLGKSASTAAAMQEVNEFGQQRMMMGLEGLGKVAEMTSAEDRAKSMSPSGDTSTKDLTNVAEANAKRKADEKRLAQSNLDLIQYGSAEQSVGTDA